MLLTLEARDGRVWQHVDERSEPLPKSAAAGDSGDLLGPLPLLHNWTQHYAEAVERGDQNSVLIIGRAMLAWLNHDGTLSGWLSNARRELDVLGTGDCAISDALLAAPWEVLADDAGFLAEDRMRLFLPLRRLAPRALGIAPDHSDLAMLFMAAAPEGQHELDYEAEEAAILEATRSRVTGQPLLHLTVEESGELEILAERHNSDGPFDILHLSCHGDIQHTGDAARHVLFLETEEGKGDAVTPDRLLDALGERLPPLLFLSACRTGQRGLATSGSRSEGRREGLAEAPGEISEAPRREAGPAAAPELAEPLARQMAAGVPHVLGWDGSVYDADAATFAEALYAGLARGETVAYAAARARHAVMTPTDLGAPGQHWHLARVYLGPGGGGPLCSSARPARSASLPASPRFLDAERKIRVAGRSEFVGRRRQLQRLRRGFAGEATGALIYGLGNLGKSSVAARLADRMPRHQLAVVVGHYDGLSILAELKRVAIPLLGAVFSSFAERAEFKSEFDAMREAVRQDEEMLGEVLRFLFDGVFAAHPLFLVIDDFEQALEDLVPGQTMPAPRPALRPALGALIGAFNAHQGTSRLLITSRYDFTAPDGAGGDSAAGLIRVPLVGMRRSEQEKQWRAKARAQSAEAVVNSDTAKLVAAALEAAAGNPGLQNVLTGPVLKGEEAAARAAVNAVTTWRETGTAPEDSNEALAFFTQMSFDTYIAALTEAERKVLAAACLFDAKVPVPRDAVAAAARALGVSDPEAGLGRLLALGLLDDFGAMAGWPGLEELPHLAANPLARPLAPRLHDDLRASAADVALPELARAWRDAKGNFARDQRATAACRLALHATAPEPEVLEAATVAAADYLFNRLGLACSALRLAKPALDRLTDARHDPSHPLSGLLINAARQAGDIAMQARLLEQALQSNTLDSGWRAFFLGLRADFLHDRGDLEQALRIYTDEVIPIHESLRNELSLAVSKGRVADLLEARGDLDDALRIRHEEELPVYEALGDRRSVAMTKLKIADVLEIRGNLKEALRIRVEEALPVFEALGDRRSVAMTKLKIADVREARGDLDEALRILKEEVLPVLEMVGDRREQAVTHGRIAGILEVRGNLDEALRIRTEEQLPIFVALNDKRSFAYTKLRIADCLENHGDFDEALRIRAEEALPLLEAIGDQRAIAVTKGKISDVYEVRGDLEEAMRLRSEEVLPAFEALEDRRSVAITKGRIADLLKIRGDLEGALRIRIEEELPVFQALEDKREQAITLGKIADILIACGDFDEALRILTEEALPIVAALGDKREQAVTHGKIADVLEARGDLDEGLRIRLEEELPVFDELRDKPQQDVTKGKIAEVLGAKGKIGAALDMHLSRLTDAEAMGMLDSLNHIRLSCARLRLQRGDHHIGGLKTIADELSMAWAGANQIGRPDVVGEVGSLFGPVLAMGGSRDQALEVLAAAASAWDMFGDTERAADCRQIIASIKGKDS